MLYQLIIISKEYKDKIKTVDNVKNYGMFALIYKNKILKK